MITPRCLPCYAARFARYARYGEGKRVNEPRLSAITMLLFDVISADAWLFAFSLCYTPP